MAILTSYTIYTFTVTKTKFILAFIIGFISASMGGYDIMLHALFILMILDFITGFLQACKEGNISNKKLKLGLTKIMLYCISIIVFYYTSIVTGDISLNGYGIRDFGISYLGVKEGLSCLRHLGNLGVPIPKGIIDKLEKFNFEKSCE